MSITLSRNSAGETAYVTKFNNNWTTIETAVNSILQSLGAGGGGTDGAAGFPEVWETSGTVGISSFQYTSSSNTHLSFTSGVVWSLKNQTIGRSTSATQISFVGKASGTYFVNVDGAGGITISTASGTTPIYTVVYNNPGFNSATRLMPILFHGDDYQRSLSGGIFGSFTRLADRLSTLEGALTLDAFYAQSGTSGTQWSYKAGQVRNNNVIFSAAASFVSLLALSSLYVEIDPANGTVSVASGGFTSGLIPIRYLKSSTAELISNEDRRTWATLAFSAISQTGPQMSGTNESFWTLNIDHTSTALSNAGLVVERGAQTDTSIRWNESLDQWEFTNDGTSFVALGGLQGLNIGAQQQTRFTMVISAPTVLNEDGRSATSLGEVSTLSLSAWVSTTTTAAILRGYIFGTKTSITNPSVSAADGIAFYRDSATTTVDDRVAKVLAASTGEFSIDMITVPVSNQACAFIVSATSECHVQFNLVGFYDLITSPGTQRVSGTSAGILVSATKGSYVTLASPFAAAMIRGLVYYLETSGNMGTASLYDIEFYNKASGANSQLASSLLFQATQIDASSAYITRLPWYYEDSNSNAQVHLRISNNGTTSGSFSVIMLAERYA